MKKKISADTKYYHFHDVNPKGKKTGDCVLRALSTVFDKQWDDVLDELVVYAHKYKQMPNDPILYTKYVKDKGYVQVKQPVHNDGTKYCGYEFCKALTDLCCTHPVLMRIGTHHVSVMTPVKDEHGIYGYKVVDTWNCSDDKVGKVYMHPDDAKMWGGRIEW